MELQKLGWMWASLVVQSVKNRPAFDSWVGKMPWRRKWHPTLVFLPGESHGQRSLVGYCPWGPQESDTTATKPNQDRNVKQDRQGYAAHTKRIQNFY